MDLAQTARDRRCVTCVISGVRVVVMALVSGGEGKFGMSNCAVVALTFPPFDKNSRSKANTSDYYQRDSTEGILRPPSTEA